MHFTKEFVKSVEDISEHIRYLFHVFKILVPMEWDGNVKVCSTISKDTKPVMNDYKLGKMRETLFSEISHSGSYENYVHKAG